jgi:hypothetical protein
VRRLSVCNQQHQSSSRRSDGGGAPSTWSKDWRQDFSKISL